MGELLAVSRPNQPMAVGRASGHPIAIEPCSPADVTTSGTRVTSARAGGNANGDDAPPNAGWAQGAPPDDPRIDLPTGEVLAGPGSSALPLPQPRSVPGLEVRDMTSSAGLSETTVVYNGLSVDQNRDGWPDLVIGRHSGPLWVLLNRQDGTFRHVGNRFRSADRHGCAAGNLDDDQFPEIVCAVGADHGLAIKDNEVWLAPLDETAGNAAGGMGLADEFGRGRQTALFDYNLDGLTDVYFSNDPSRADGLPDANRLFRNTAGHVFVPAPQAGLDIPVGGACLIPVDIDGDGWPDLIVCEDIQAAGYQALHVFHNDHGTFDDWTHRLAIDGGDVRAAAAGDLDGNGTTDLVTMTRGVVDIWLQRAGAFHRALEYDVPSPSAVTLADINGDGAPDLYITRGEEDGPAVQDVLLLNDGSGTHWVSVKLPSVQPGPGGGAIPIDYDGNGRQDLVVMHGDSRVVGPIQLLAFGPPWPFEITSSAR
jgi:FG-GAP-like repeat